MHDLYALEVTAGQVFVLNQLACDVTGRVFTLAFEGAAINGPTSFFSAGDCSDSVLGVHNTGTVRVVGHTDSVGDDGSNQVLSLRRAQAIVDSLEGLGVASSRLRTEGAGETSPVAPNEHPDGADNPEGRALNRRVEVYFTARN